MERIPISECDYFNDDFNITDLSLPIQNYDLIDLDFIPEESLYFSEFIDRPTCSVTSDHFVVTDQIVPHKLSLTYPANEIFLPTKYTKHSSKGKNTRFRTAFMEHQLLELERTFANKKYLTRIERQKMASKLELKEQQLKIWFQNRRMKAKKENAKTSQSLFMVRD